MSLIFIGIFWGNEETSPHRVGLRNKGRKETFCYMPFVLFIFLPRAFLSYKSNTFQKYIKAEKGTSVQPWKNW